MDIRQYDCISQVVLSNAELFPEKVVIVDCDGKRETTWRELRTLIIQIANKAVQLGLKGVVPVVQGRTVEYVATVLGLNLAGIAVSPLGDDYPPARLKYIMHDLRAETIADAAFVKSAQKSPAKSYVTFCEKNNIAWVIYTSSSTGNPKGVTYSNSGICTACMATANANGVGEDTISGATSPFSFCASIVDLYTTLYCGGTVHIISNESRKDLHLLGNYLLHHSINYTFIAPRMLAAMRMDLPAMKIVATAGERVYGISPRSYQINVMYGMTESIALASYFVLDKYYDNTPIGKPAFGKTIYLLDEKGELNHEGEICISGVLADGYWNLPELTAGTFTKNTFSDDPQNCTLLHTGDIGRLLPDGNLLFLNRNDWMVKINGQRVEPGEIEYQIEKIDGVTGAVVKGFENVRGQSYLCAWFTANSSVTEEYVKSELASKLVSYMIPAFIIKIDTFPLNENGKVERKALIAPNAKEFLSEYEAPVNELERALCISFQKVLGIETIGRSDDFFTLGGDSILAVTLCSELTGYSLKYSDVFAGRTPQGIASLCGDTTIRQGEGSYKDGEDSYPITAGQAGVYYACMNAPGNLMYNNPFACKLAAQTDSTRLYNAIRSVLNHYPAFGVRFQIKDGQVRMIKRSPYVDIQLIDAQDIDIPDIKRGFVRLFDIEKGELARFMLVRSESALYFLADIHHVIFDGSSISVFLNAVSKAYMGETIPAESVSIFQSACMEQDIVTTRAYERAYEYFQANFSTNSFVNTLSADNRSCGDDTLGKGKTIEYELNDVANASRLECFASKHGITEATLFMGAFAWALSKMAGLEECSFCTVQNGRESAEYDGTIGMLVRTMPISVIVDESLSASTYLSEFRTLFYEAMGHSIYPFFRLSEQYGISNDIMFAYQADMFDNLSFNGNPIQLEMIDSGYALSKLSVSVYKLGGAYKATVTYRSGIITEKKIHVLISLMQSAVSGFMKQLRLRDIPLVGNADFSMLESYHGHDITYVPCSVVDMLGKAMKQYPDNIAVVSGKKKICYRELDEITDRVASYLIKQGIGKEDVVAILSDRDEMMVICPIAVLKTGAMYLPLDNTYPLERLSLMLNDSGAKLLMTPNRLGLLTDTGINTFFTEDIEQLAKCDVSLPMPAPEDAFAILYTSGSTGKPKGCILDHNNITHYIRFYSKRARIDDKSRVLAYSSFGFDANIMDTYPTLCMGAAIYVVPIDMRLDLGELNRYIEENKITHAFFTTQIARQFVTTITNKSLLYIGAGGEELIPCEAPQDCELVNIYGPTECTVFVTSFTVDRLYSNVPIGRANDNVRIYVVDKYLRRLPIGVPGELCVAGPQVSRGYLNHPQKTAESFVDNPFTDNPKYKRMYRTGDIVCFLPDGDLQFMGRKDTQVKIRGFRIELAEVEEVIRRFDGIKDATVAVFDHANGEKKLAAYVVSDHEVNIDNLNKFIRSEKPAYMVPSVIMQIDRIPLTHNQKVDKKALPAPTHNTDSILLPTNELQQTIFDLVADVLGYNDFGINTDLFCCGLTSISSIKLISRLSKSFGRHITMMELKENNTIEKLESFLTINKEHQRLGIREEYPLTKTQENIFWECMNRPDSTFYNVPYLIKLGVGVDVERLKRAIVETINAHPYLMTTLFISNDGLRCKRDNNVHYHLSNIEEITVESTDRVGERLCKPFELQGGRLFRIALIYSESETLLFIDVHHVIFDGTSLSLFIEDINRAYAGESLQAEVFSGYEAALYEESIRETDALEKARRYYSELLADYEGTSIPQGDHPNESGYSTYEYLLQNFNQTDGSVFCHAAKITMSTLFTSAFGFLLAKYKAGDSAVFTTVYDGRTDSRLAHSISMYVKTYPVLCNITNRNIYDYVNETAIQIAASRLNDSYSFAEIHSDLGIQADVIFVYQGHGFEHDTFCGKKLVTQEVSIDTGKAPLTICVALKESKVCVTAEYDASTFSKEFIKYFVESYERVLVGMVIKTTLSEIELVDDKVLALLERFHGENIEYEPCTIVDMLHDAMNLYPDNIAVVNGTKKLSYKELDEITDRLASALVKRGIGREDVVAILVDRDEMMAICPIAVIKAGAVYQPLDNAYPSERLSYMLKDSGAKMLITNMALNHYVTTNIDVLFAEDIQGLEECDIVLPSPAPHDAFVIFYTSGSTGLPKGCVLEHSNFVHFCRFYSQRFHYNEYSATAAYAGFGFDANMMDLFVTLCSGATLHIITSDMRLDLERLNSYFEENNITHAFMTTLVGRQFVTSVNNHSLKYLIMGGEVLAPLVPPQNYTIVNGYGPTETTCGVSVFDIDRLYQSVPIGKPNTNIKAYVVDKQLSRVPIGVPGELCVAGPQVSRGYLNHPKKTAEVFVDNPFTSDPKYKRMYRTGDIVCFLPDGNLQFIGRKDAQVKIRGFRIELTEVEEVIRRFNGIKDVTVVVFDHANGEKKLAAYIVSDQEVNIDDLNKLIRSEKPEYMVPYVIMQIDKIPLTQNHKVNKRALPVPTLITHRSYIPPKDELEKDFCMMMGDTLKIEQFSAQDNFFEMGGSSITATKLLVKAVAKGYTVSYSDLFRYPSPKDMAKHIKAIQSSTIVSRQKETIANYDYTAINSFLHYSGINAVDKAIDCDSSILNGKLGTVLLTGATGFLGIHILHEYITSYGGKIICLVRKGEYGCAQERLKAVIRSYFSNDYAKAFEQGFITCIDADINDHDLSHKLRELEIETIIHCAASVKHFASDNTLYHNNTEGTQNVLRIAEERKLRFIHISTSSVSGFKQEGLFKQKFTETDLFIGQRMDNDYICSKFLAERYLLEAALRGVYVRVLRVGNLMNRFSDGEFQNNLETNGFMRNIRGVLALGYSSEDLCDKTIDFSPIDSTAQAVLKIADSDLPALIYHVYNNHLVHVSELTDAFKELGFPMKIVSEMEYRQKIAIAVHDFKDDAYMSDIIAGLIAYKDAVTGTELESVDISNAETIQVLSRLGFTWPKIGKPYIHQLLEKLIDSGFVKQPELAKKV